MKTDTKPFKTALDAKKASGKAVKAAMTFPGGTHDLWIRYWLAAGGIDPDKDIETIVVPPPQMVANMKVGTMDCFCVCEPWNLQLIHQNIGYTAITTGELWNKHPEKSFALRAAYVDKNPKAAMALLMAVMEAQRWCEKAENRQEAAAIPVTAFDVELVRALQDDIELVEEPFARPAAAMGLSQERLLEEALRLQRQGHLRRFAAVLRHRQAGFTANGMAVWAVPAEEAERLSCRAGGAN